MWRRFDATLLAPVPHRQVVLTIPKRLRAYCLYRRRLIGEIARVAAHTVTAAIRTLSETTRRWATLLQQIFEVDPLACPTCHGAMRIVAFITQTSVIDRILTHLRTRAAREAHAGPRSPPSTREPTSRGASRSPHPSAVAPTVP